MSKVTKSANTRVDTAAAYNHYLQVITVLKPDDAICQSLEFYGIESLPDLLDMDRDNIKALEYLDSKNKNTPLHCGGQGHARVMQAYFQYLGDEGIDVTISHTHNDFKDYRMNIYDPNTLPIVPSTKSMTKTSVFPTNYKPAEDFKKSIKRDKTYYFVLKDDKQWDNWRRVTVAIARSHNCEDVFDPNYKP